jgi:2-dehydropantoate 2-reductase
MKHCILGPGGIGGLLGAVLASAGDDVTVVGRSAEHPPSLTLTSPFGNLNVPVRVAQTVAGDFDVLWITVKAPDLTSALSRVAPSEKFSAVVPLLNGIDHVRALRQRFGNDSVVPATIAVESERAAPGVIVHRSPFVRLFVSTAGRERLQPAIDHLAQFGFECRYVDDEVTLMWRKLVFLAPVALATTAGPGAVGDVLSDPGQKARLEAMVREACAVGAASGAKLEPDVVLTGIAALPAHMRSSMQKDVAAGKTPELDAIAGPILRGGTEHGIIVTATRAAVAAVEQRAREVQRR